MAVLRSFTYLPMEIMGHVFGRGWWNVGDAISPDFLSGPFSPPARNGSYDEFGWRFQGGVLDGEQAKLIGLVGASVQRRSLGRDRYHIEMAPGVCARDSYHDGEWLGPHIGERIEVGLKTADGSTDTVSVNLMDDAPVEQEFGEAVLVSHFWADNYAHTLLETASRFWAFDEHAYLLGDLPVIWDTNKPWQKEVAEMLAPGRVIGLPANKVRFSTLYVPSFHSQIGQSPQSVAWLRKRFGAPETAGSKRIFVSRADALERRVVNENEVLDVLKPLGFESVILTGMTVKEQMDLFSHAEAVVMPHGAGCANMIFAGTGTKIIEFVPKSYQHHMFWHVAKWCGHWYGRMVCEDGPNKDMSVDLGALRNALQAGGL